VSRLITDAACRTALLNCTFSATGFAQVLKTLDLKQRPWSGAYCGERATSTREKRYMLADHGASPRIMMCFVRKDDSSLFV